MKKFKINFGEGGIKGFFVRHVEKVVLLIAVMMVGVLFAAGYQVESIEETKTPASLLARVENARGHIEKNTWDVLREVRTPANDYPQRVEKNLTATDWAVYPMPMPFKKPEIPPVRKRDDPQIYPPIKLEAKGTYGPVAMVPQTGDIDRLITLPPATVKATATAASPTRSTTTSRRGNGEGLPGYPSLIPGVQEGPSYESGLPGMTGGSVAGQPRQLTPEQLAELTGDYQAQSGVIAKGHYVVSLTAVVPYELQFEEYQRTLADSRSYDPARDFPSYIFYYVERADVPADPNAPLVWKRISHYNDAMRVANTWAGTPPPYADPATIDPVLTMPVPPILMKKLEKFALHSEIRAAVTDSTTIPGEEPGTEDGTPGDTPADVPFAAGPSVPGGPGMEGEGGRMPYQPRGQGMPPGVYGEGGYGEGGYGAEGSMGMDPTALPKYKLFRFFDMTAQWGKSYRYRVQLLLNDPNRARDPKMDPSPLTLSDEVLARVKQLNASDPMRKSFWRETEWSEPSDVITLPSLPQKMLAGSVKAPSEMQLPLAGTMYKFQKSGSEPTATVLSVIWDKDLAIEVPGELEVSRASVLNFTKSADVLHPVSLELKALDNYTFTTDATVVDIRGGDVLPGGDRKNPLTAPGEILILDRSGNLQAHNEIDEVSDYRKSLLIAETPPAAASAIPGEENIYGGEDIYGGEGGRRPGPLRGGGRN